MSKANNPTTFSDYFKISASKLDELGVFDPTLAIDTKLFIDPLLFPNSQHTEIKIDATHQYKQHFENVIKFLAATKTHEDVPWRTARRLLQFHELKGTCLGYGANSISGSGFGSELTERILVVGKEIVDLGIRDPDLFPAMALFESKIGPDRISDMATNVAQNALIKFNFNVLKAFGLKGESFDFNGMEVKLLVNPFQNNRTPIILVPTDILRKLPIAHDWDGVADAADQNEALRKRVNNHIGQIWAQKTKRDKAQLRAAAIANRDAFQTLLDAIHGVPLKAYNTISDPDGVIQWARKAKEYADRFPIKNLSNAPTQELQDVYWVVNQIVAQFRFLIEKHGLNRELYKENRKPRHESTAQRLFFAIAYSYCKANNVDISPEVDTGNGKIDFKLSRGMDSRVLVEVKLSINKKLVPGYQLQLDTYKESEQTMYAIYLIIDVGGMGSKFKRLLDMRNATKSRGEPLSDLEMVDGIIKPTASNR